MSGAIEIEDLSYRFGERVALREVRLSIQRGEIYGLLGPNGGGKTTLFRLLTTALAIQRGRIAVLGCDTQESPDAVRRQLGVVFQFPSLDKKLTVLENLRHHARLYGVPADRWKPRAEQLLTEFTLSDRQHDLVERLSGGLARRVELAKGLLHEPQILVMDEPSTGLDPGARRDLWRSLERCRSDGMTILLTTHLMDEAERCDRVAILDQGRLVVEGKPVDLCSELGGSVVTLRGSKLDRVALELERLGLSCRVDASGLRFEASTPWESLVHVRPVVGEEVDSISIARPTLEDVFLKKTGHSFWSEESR